MNSILFVEMTFGEAVHSEFRRADRLAQSEYFTEAVVRLGRGVEAALYATARELSVDLTHRVIKDLEKIRSDLQGRQVKLLQHQTDDAVRELANVSKLLAESIALLSVNKDSRAGELDEQPRANEQLLKELITSVRDDSVGRRLAEGLGLMRNVQGQRNRAAHASIDGTPQEFSADEYDNIRTGALKIVELLTDVLLGVRAAKEWPMIEFKQKFVLQVQQP
jgi:hypothetical protein